MESQAHTAELEKLNTCKNRKIGASVLGFETKHDENVRWL